MLRDRETRACAAIEVESPSKGGKVLLGQPRRKGQLGLVRRLLIRARAGNWHTACCYVCGGGFQSCCNRLVGYQRHVDGALRSLRLHASPRLGQTMHDAVLPLIALRYARDGPAALRIGRRVFQLFKQDAIGVMRIAPAFVERAIDSIPGRIGRAGLVTGRNPLDSQCLQRIPVVEKPDRVPSRP